MNIKGRVFLKRKEVTIMKVNMNKRRTRREVLLITIHEQVMKKDKDQVMKNKDRNKTHKDKVMKNKDRNKTDKDKDPHVMKNDNQKE